MGIEIRTISDDDFDAVGAILDGAYGPAPARVERTRRYVSLDREAWLLALAEGEPAGMAGVVDFATFAYVGLVGVLPAAQRRGIALALMERLLSLLERRGTPTALLDASEMGEPLYLRLGFVEDDRVELWTSEGAEPRGPLRGEPGPRVRPLVEADLPAVTAFDRGLSGADRGRLLAAYLRDFAGRAFVAPDGSGGLSGYLFAQSHSVGPWLAADAGSAAALLEAALSLEFGGAPTVAVPAANREAVALLERAGFGFRRSLAHMRLGEPVPGRRRATIYGQASLAAG